MIDEQSVAHLQNTQCSDVFPQRFCPLDWCSCVAPLDPMTRLDGTQGRQVSHEAKRGGHSTPASSHWNSNNQTDIPVAENDRKWGLVILIIHL